MSLGAAVLLVLKISIGLSVFALGLKATFADATFLFRRRDQLARAFLSMNVLMPLLAYFLVMRFNLNPAGRLHWSHSPYPQYRPSFQRKR